MYLRIQCLLTLCVAVGLSINDIACARKPAPAGTTGSAAGVTWIAPARWQVQAKRPMRVATYVAPPASGDKEGAECGVFFFGPGQGGDVEMNVTRWQRQFKNAEGETAKSDRRNFTVHGVPVTTLSVAGTYLASMGPMFQTGAAKKPDYRMLGAVVEAPQGNVFFKFTGPAGTIAAAEEEFKEMMNSLKKE